MGDPSLGQLADALDAVAHDSSFSGIVRIDRNEEIEFAKAYGFADRAHEIENTLDTQFATASATKGLTALTVARLIEDGALTLETTARSVLGDDLALIGADVTIEHLLAHRSGIGDYLDEETEGLELTDYLMQVPVHELAETEDYLRVLDGHATKFPPDERFSYSNSGYVVLALIAERTGGRPFRDLVRAFVCDPAGMGDTEFLRSDELPGRAAIGYLENDTPRTNVFHLPVRGSGDGGVYTTVADMSAFWSALFGGRIVAPDRVAEMTRPRSDVPPRRYGLGFWLEEDAVLLIGSDAGVSFRSRHEPATGTTETVIANTGTGARPVVRLLDELRKA